MPNSRDAYASLADGGDKFEGGVTQSDWFRDLGQTGLKRTSGILDEEFLPALKGSKAVKVYGEMWNNNATIHALIFSIQQLLSQTKWTVVIDDRTADGEKAVKFLESVMDDMTQSWPELISEIITCVVFGWSFHEIVYKRRVGPWETEASKRSKYTDGMIGWRKIPIRAQETLHRWVFDDHGGVKGMVQIAAPKYEQIFIPIEKALLFRVGAHKNNPEGRSLLRGSYRSWYLMKRMEELEAIAVERDMAGMPVARIPSHIMTSKDPKDQQMFKAFKNLVKNVRRDEHHGLVIPSDTDPDTKQPLYNLELMSSTGSHTMDTSTIIQRLQKDILMSVLADFILLGNTSAGSYAMHVDKTGIFKQALNSISEAIADVFNRHAVPRLFALNGWKPDELPRFRPEPVENPNLQELASFMTAMASLGESWFPDPMLSKYVRDIAALPEMSTDKEEALAHQEEKAIKDSMIDEVISDQQKQNQLETESQGGAEQVHQQGVEEGMQQAQAQQPPPDQSSQGLPPRPTPPPR